MQSARLTLILVLGFSLWLALPAPAQQHRATRLGNPATRFATPLEKPEDLRQMLTSESLRADVNFIARERGYQGTEADLIQAARTAVIMPIKIPVGTRLPAMSSRKNGKPVLLRDVLWAGQTPIDAYEFFFSSAERRYRLVCPKACANFWIEDFGAAGRPELLLSCTAPPEVRLRREADFCLQLRNTGTTAAGETTITALLPTNAVFVRASLGGQVREGKVIWALKELGAQAQTEMCVTVRAEQPGEIGLAATAQTVLSKSETFCQTINRGVPAIRLEVVDLEDPIEVGSPQTYVVEVLNQGSEALTNLKLNWELETAQAFKAAFGATPVLANELKLSADTLERLNPRETAVWRISVTARQPGDVRFITELHCDQFETPIREVEATQQY